MISEEARERRDGRFKRKKPALPDWRRYANSHEAADLEGLEKNAEVLDSRRRKVSIAIAAIRTRCLQRRKLALANAEKTKSADATP